MSQRILFGDPFTMVVRLTRDRSLQLLHCKVDDRGAGFIRSTNWPGLYEGVEVADEGITWCRGHVGKNSEEAQALLAAAHLHETTRIPVRHNDGWGNAKGAWRLTRC